MTDTPVRELTLTRTFDAPPQLVWDAYTVPAQLTRWWGPNGMRAPLETITVDLRPGGAFCLTMVSDDGTRYPSVMTFREVVPIQRLAFGWDAQATGIAGGEVIVELAEQAGGTLLVQRFVGEISPEMFPMMEQGTGEQLDKLAALLAR